MKKIIFMISILVFTGALWTAQPFAQDAKGFFKDILTDETGIKESHEALRHLINQTVVDLQGRNLGRVKNIVVGERGGINYLIIASSDDRLIPIPWEVANPTLKDDRLQISVDRERVEGAPGFSSDEWPNLASSRIEGRVRGYYDSQQGSGRRDLDVGTRERDPRDLNR